MKHAEIIARYESRAAWRIQAAGEKAGGGLWIRVVPYLQAPDIDACLDEIAEAEGGIWSLHVERVEDGILATVAITDSQGRRASRTDGAPIKQQEGSEADPFPTAITAAYKRAAQRWGVGRDLRRQGAVFGEVVEVALEGGDWFKGPNRAAYQTPVRYKGKDGRRYNATPRGTPPQTALAMKPPQEPEPDVLATPNTGAGARSVAVTPDGAPASAPAPEKPAAAPAGPTTNRPIPQPGRIAACLPKNRKPDFDELRTLLADILEWARTALGEDWSSLYTGSQMKPAGMSPSDIRSMRDDKDGRIRAFIEGALREIDTKERNRLGAFVNERIRKGGKA